MPFLYTLWGEFLMARVTVEDCLRYVPNRFALVVVAAKRTRQLMKGAQCTIQGHDDNTEAVIALREIGSGHVRIPEHLAQVGYSDIG